MADEQNPISGIAIAVVASGDFSLYNGFSIPEALGSAWTTLLVSANWYTNANAEHQGDGRLNFSLDIPEIVDPQWGAAFAFEVAQRAANGSPLIPDIPGENLNGALLIITGVTAQFIRGYSELVGNTFDEAVEQLRTAYLGSILD